MRWHDIDDPHRGDHVSNPLIGTDLHAFLRDTHDDLAIMLDMLAGEGDRLADILEIYFSSLAIRTTDATKTLTLLGNPRSWARSPCRRW